MIIHFELFVKSQVPISLYTIAILAIARWIIGEHYRFKTRFLTIALITLPLFPIILPWVPSFSHLGEICGVTPQETTTTPIVNATIPAINIIDNPTPFNWMKFLYYSWLIIFALIFLYNIAGYYYLTKIWSARQVPAQGRVKQYFDQLVQEAKVKRSVHLYIGKETAEPGTFGFFQPVIIIPEFLTQNFSEKDLRIILWHELVHIKRWDQVKILLQRFVLSFYFFHPLVWFLCRELNRSLEIACDEEVTHFENGKDYARAIVHFLEYKNLFHKSHFHFAVGYFDYLKLRISRLTHAHKIEDSSFARKISAVAAGMIIFSLLLINKGEARYLTQTIAQAAANAGNLIIENKEKPEKKKGYAAMHVASYDTEDPLENGKKTIYVIEVRNEGTLPCTNVRIRNTIPAQMQLIGAKGPKSYKTNGNTVYFDPVEKLNPGQVMIYRVETKALRAGSALNTAFIEYDEFDQVIRDQEGTSIYE